jgi:excisionase family DNA binding protein
VSADLFTTVQVAKLTKIPRATLQHWVKTRKIAAPRVKLVKGKAVRLWSLAQIEKACELKGTLKPGPKPK